LRSFSGFSCWPIRFTTIASARATATETITTEAYRWRLFDWDALASRTTAAAPRASTITPSDVAQAVTTSTFSPKMSLATASGTLQRITERVTMIAAAETPSQ